MIKQITYHILKKEENVSSFELNPNKEIVATDSDEEFLTSLEEAYANKTGKSFGRFAEDQDSYPMPNLLNDYLINNDDFYRLSERMMNVLLKHFRDKGSATGGKVFIVHYEYNQNEFILIAILNDKTRFIAENWMLNKRNTLDIEALKYAGRINLTKWLAGDSRYISFIKGTRNQGDVSQYFQDFLGCNDTLIAREETTKLVQTIKYFIQEQDLSNQEKALFLETAHNYLKKNSDDAHPFDVTEFTNTLWPKDPAKLVEKLTDPDTGISEGFVPDKRSLRSIIFYTAKTKFWNMSFSQDAIVNGDILEENGKIIISNPPEGLLAAFKNR